MRMRTISLVVVLCCLALLGACGPNEPATGLVGINVGSFSGAAAKSSPLGLASGSETIALGPDTVVVTDVELVLKHMKFKDVGDTAPCTSPDSSMEGEGDCDELEVGPVLADLPLGGGVAHLFTVPVLVGTYQGVEFLIHRLGLGGVDAAFLAQHPGLDGVSIRVTGTFNGTPFTFTSWVTAVQEQGFDAPVVVLEDRTVDVSIMVDVSGWFLNDTQTALVDPATALPGQPNEYLVAQNIRSSFQAFHDQDHDGLPDD